MVMTVDVARAFLVILRTRVAALVRTTSLRVTMPSRAACAAVCLPAALASLLVGLLPGRSTAGPGPELRAQIERAAKSPPVMLELMNRQTISGALVGFVGDWRDTAEAVVRYEAWRELQAEGVPRLGDRMILILTSGDKLHGSFRGVGPTFLALGTGNSRFDIPVEFESITAARADSAAGIVPWIDLRGRLLDAPTLIGVVLKQGPVSMMISREAIFSVRGAVPASSSNSGNIALLVVLGVVGVALICASAAQSASNDVGRDLTACSNSVASSRSVDRSFGNANVTHGLPAWRHGETRRP